MSIQLLRNGERVQRFLITRMIGPQLNVSLKKSESKGRWEVCQHNLKRSDVFVQNLNGQRSGQFFGMNHDVFQWPSLDGTPFVCFSALFDVCRYCRPTLLSDYWNPFLIASAAGQPDIFVRFDFESMLN